MTVSRIAAALAATFILATAATPASAQAPVEKMLSEQNVKSALQNALENIQHGMCGDKKKCEPATKAELKKPPISIDDARGAIKAGIASGTMQWCDLSWNERNFQPFLVHYQTGEGMDNRQLALMALIHGFHQKAIFVQLQKNGPCPPDTAKAMSSQMPLENLEEK